LTITGEGNTAEKIYPEITETNNPQVAFRNYLEALGKMYKFRGAVSTLKKEAVWGSTSIVSKDSSLVAEHPDWVLKSKSGKPVYYSEKMFMLDISVSEVRDFILRVLTTLIKEWGFEGIKLDFWSGEKLSLKSSPLKINLPSRNCRVFVLSNGEYPG